MEKPSPRTGGVDDTVKALSEKQSDWLVHIKRCDVRDESDASYCKREVLKVTALYAAPTATCRP